MSPDGSAAFSTQSRIVIFSLGRFEIVLNGMPLRFKGRAPVRALELLAALVAAGEGGMSSGRLADQLWPDADGFDAYRAFTTTLHRLRHLLGVHEAVRLCAGRLTLDPQICTVDAWVFERALRGAADCDAIEAVLDTYSGPFLADDEKPWALAARQRIEGLIARKADRVPVVGKRRRFRADAAQAQLSGIGA
jgi:two-component SAPR family response regulator